MHIRRWTHTMPMLRQSSQPAALGLTGLMASRWVQRPGWPGSNLTSIVVLIRAVTIAPPRTDGTEGWPSFVSRDCGGPWESYGRPDLGMRGLAVEQLPAGLGAQGFGRRPWGRKRR